MANSRYRDSQLTKWGSPQSDALRIVADLVRAEPPAPRRPPPPTITYYQPTSQAVTRVSPTSRVIARPPPQPVQLYRGESSSRESNVINNNGNSRQVEVYEGWSRRDGSHAKYTHETTYTYTGKETLQILEYSGPTGSGEFTKRTCVADDSSDDEGEYNTYAS